MSRANPPPGATLVDAAHEQIRRRILDNVWPPGHRMLEQEVALALGMSRTPVREALVRLQNDGLVEAWLFQNDGRFALKTLAKPQRSA